MVRAPPPLPPLPPVYYVLDDCSNAGSISLIKSYALPEPENVHVKGPLHNKTIITRIDVRDAPIEPSAHFAMLYLSYMPNANWERFCLEEYALGLSLSSSPGIHHIQLEIKNSSQRKFVDIRLKTPGRFKKSLNQLASAEAWADI